MSETLSDRVKERISVIGTGDVQVGTAAPIGFRNFPAVMTVDGPPAWVCIADTFSGAWEVTSSMLIAGNKLQRVAENVLSSSAGPGVLVNFPGNVCDVFQTLPAAGVISTANFLVALTALLNALPQTLPATSGVLWNNGGVPCLS